MWLFVLMQCAVVLHAVEFCDGLDNDANGMVDDAPLSDAPLPGQSGCWRNLGNCCTFGSLSWCPPAGATCNSLGTLTSPCAFGTLECQSGSWACVGPVGPSTEVCDGIDNNCDGIVDNNIPNLGQICGTDVGECVTGLTTCSNGIISCQGSVEAASEICDGKDNDCDGVNDDNIPNGGPCVPSFDQLMYPNTPTTSVTGACERGLLECQEGAFTCVGGVGPQPEACDGVDNDCDGFSDEAGTPPNGVECTQEPTQAPTNAPTLEPTNTPTLEPTTLTPTAIPTTGTPTTLAPTRTPTTAEPTRTPTTAEPTRTPTLTLAPTLQNTVSVGHKCVSELLVVLFVHGLLLFSQF